MQPVTKDLSRQLRDAWEIDRSNLEFLKVLGRGNFGEVWKGLICELLLRALNSRIFSAENENQTQRRKGLYMYV